MKIEKKKIGDKEIWPFTIPSGIITTKISALEKIAQQVPELGILTTKSIGPEPRIGNREPIFAQHSAGCFINAVGLENPGALAFAKKLSSANLPKDKFLLASIFGKNTGEFVYVAKILESLVDGFELNLSCPHAEGYGMQLGQDPKLVYQIVKEAVKFNKLVFAKLSPIPNIAEVAEAAMKAGAYGITAINTVPGSYIFDGYYVLSNKIGGLSGKGIVPVGIKCVKDITDKLGSIPIIACGGISNALDVKAYDKVGASFFGIGSCLIGMTEDNLRLYFSALLEDLARGTNNAVNLLKTVDMRYKKFKVSKKIDLASDLHLLKMNNSLNAKAGQFVFAWIPEKGEKPFSVLDTEPLTIGFLQRGCFTKELADLKENDVLYFRGPYGQGLNEIEIPENKKIVLAGGGSGIFGICLFAKQIAINKNNLEIFLGAKNKEHVPLLNEFKKYGKVHVSTEDGSEGEKGFVSYLLKRYLSKGDYFYNCGPREMVKTVVEIEKKFTKPENIYSSIEYMTKCGVGVCGSCADEKGRRTCVEGPFMKLK